jgi:CRP-like cAMP-binding protein
MRRADPSVDQRLLQILAARLQETMDQLMEVLFISMETRVISMETRVLRVLLRLAEAFDSNTTPIIVRVRQDDIAAMAGTRRQTANRPLKAAEAEGAI